MHDLIEDDWKHFRNQFELWRENYLSKVNKKLATILADESICETDKFYKLKKTCNQRAKVLSDSFDNIRRSNMTLRLARCIKIR